jgi:hypothetical protein
MTPYILQKLSSFKVDNPLVKYAYDISSQSGEDGIIQKIFEVIKPDHFYCVELGGWDGKYLSNCYNLIENIRWSGCFIEANESKFTELIKTHGANPKVKCINKFVDFEGINSLDNILLSIGAPKNFDLLSIDVDGIDFFIWESLQFHLPNVIVIEFNPTVPNDIVFVQPKNISINQGCSLLSLIILGKNKGYELICCTGWNAFFVKQEHYHKFHIESNEIHHMYQPLMDGRIFQGYDSYIYVHGIPKLMWADMELSNEAFQVLPKECRHYFDSQFKFSK